jgi:hypothetical protein
MIKNAVPPTNDCIRNLRNKPATAEQMTGRAAAEIGGWKEKKRKG